MWVATGVVLSGGPVLQVSIHATRVGGDYRYGAATLQGIQFLSTPPVWVATAEQDALAGYVDVSIHATRVGGDYAGPDQ